MRTPAAVVAIAALAGSATLSYAAAPARTKLPARHSAAPAAHPTLGSVRARWSK